MEFKGTKGKWFFRKNGYQTIKVLGTKTKKVCEINCNLNNKLDHINYANALLISKAPEMLEMLKRTIDLLNDIDSTLFHYNIYLKGWHLNGDLEPIMNIVSEMDMDVLSEAEQLIKEATEI